MTRNINTTIKKEERYTLKKVSLAKRDVIMDVNNLYNSIKASVNSFSYLKHTVSDIHIHEHKVYYLDKEINLLNYMSSLQISVLPQKRTIELAITIMSIIIGRYDYNYNKFKNNQDSPENKCTYLDLLVGLLERPEIILNHIGNNKNKPDQGYTRFRLKSTLKGKDPKTVANIYNTNAVAANEQELPQHENSHIIVRDNETGKDVAILTSAKNLKKGTEYLVPEIVKV